MNKIYKIVWNKALGQMVVVSEHAKSAAKGTTVGTHLSRPLHKTQNVSACPQWLLCSLSLSMVLLANATWAGVANTALPTGANITQGSAQISQNHNTLNITQNSQNLSTNWNSFNIGKDATVNFNQPNQSSIAVNRVLDNNASQIMGKLNANGQVFLLNPNGVIFSKTAQVNVGGIVASTLNLSDSDIAQGKFTLKNNGNAGSVENYGSIIAGGGVVALIAPTVKNHGTIQAHNGVVHLTAADQVTLALQDGSLTEYQIDVGTLQGLVENGGAIQADNGAVYLTAQAKNSLSKAVVNHTGIIEANRLSKNAKGEIILLADMQHGTTTVSGTLKAEGKNGADGGFIETSAANIQIQDSTKVSTLSDSGKTGEWLIDPFNVTISNQAQAGNNNVANTFTPSQNDSIINVGTLNSALASNNITVTTAGAGTQAGNINVNADVTWSANTALTLRADNDIHINANITATNNNGKLNLQYGQTTSNINANYYLNNGAKVNLKAGQNFSTQKGANAPINYTVITDLGAAGSTTRTDLQGMSGDLLWNYVLGADINAATTSGWNAGLGFNPIGTQGNEFKGKFDGLNHTISNLNINRANQYYVGLFGATNNATIQNIGLIQANIKGYNRVGALIGEANFTNTSNAFSTGQVKGYQIVGGLVGANQNQSSILSSYSNAQVTATNSFAGGLSGANEFSSRIENSYATGAVQAQGFSGNAGGLSGNNYTNSVIKNSYATGAVSGIERVGGLLGNNDSSTVENSYATGQVTKTSGSAITFGGLVGWSGGTIKNSYWNSATTGQTQAVGDNSGNLTSVVGLTTAQMFDKNSLSGFDFDIIWGNGDNQTTPYLKNHIGLNNVINKNDTVAGASYAVIQTLNQLQGMSGNLIGKYVLGADIDATATSGWNNGQGFNPIGNSSNRFTGKFDGLNHTISNLTINRQSQDYVGLFGATNNSTIQNIGLIQANVRGSWRVGALIGEANYTNTSNAFSTGLVNGDVGVGGLVGNNQNQSSILSSYSNAQVTATDSFAGGLSGLNQSDSRIENSYATGAVQAQGSNSNAGGLSGNNYSNSVIKNSYATGAVSGIENVGGLLGNNNSSTVENSYATGQVTRTSGSAITFGGLVGRTGGTIKNSYWNKDTTGQGAAVGNATGTLTQVQGLTTAQMKQGASFVGFNIDGQGGTAKVWRIYEGNTAPLLRSFLTQADISATANQTKAYNGQIQGLDTTIFTGLDSSKIFSSNSSSKNVGTYNVGYYSNQQGYDLIGGSASLTINKADLAITGLSAGNKVYDATTVATLTGTPTITQFGSDSVTLSGDVVAAFANKNVGTNKAVTVTGFTLSGADAGNYNLVQPTGLTATISQRTLNATLTAQNKIYDGNNSASVSYGDDRIGQDVLVVSGTATFSDKNAATGKTVTATGLALTGTDAGNYELASTTATTQADIDKATLTATITAQNKIYDGNNSASVSYGDDRIGQDVLVISGTATFSDKNAATGKTVTATGLALTGTDAGNYELASTTATTQADIDKATLTATITAQNKIYDGNNSASVSYGDDRIGQDVLVVSGTATFSDKNAATGKTVTATGLALTGTDAGNYELASTTATTQADIDKATLTATLNAQNKIYDGNNSASVSYGDDRIGQDVLVVSGTATFSDKNAATGKTVTATGLALTGTDAGNYELASTTATTQADIDKATLTATITAQNKIYDGNTSASVSYGDDRIGQDALTITGTATFNDKNAATGKTVTANNLALTGTDAGNYELASTTATTQADIDKATLTATITAQNKIYDGNTSASVSYGDDRIGQDVLVISGTATFSDKNAATGKTVTANNLALTGTDAGNYELASTTATTQADIDKATLTATITAQNKIYDGNNSASVSYGDDRIGQDVLVVSGTATFSDKNAATGKTVTATGLALTGTDAGNYELASTTATTQADIDKATLTATITAQNKIYDGNNSASVSYGDDRIGQDVLVVSGTATFSDKNAGSNKTVIVNGLTLSGADAGNYVLAATTATDTADISKAQAIVTANSLNTVYNGQNQTASGFSATGLVNGEDSSVLTGVTASVTAKDAGSYTNKANGVDKNYDLTFVDGALEIAKAKATVTANSLNTVYNGKDQTVTGFTASGLVNGETEAVLSGVTATVTGKNAGSYINTATGTDGNYDITFVDGALEIAKAKATVTANSLNTVYNGKDQTVTGFSASGLVAGEDEAVLSGVTATVTGKNAGSYINTATGTDGNYDITFVDGALDIAKAKATITANSLNTVYNGQNQTASGFSATGLVNGEDSSVLTGVTASVTAKDAGSYTNKANGVDKNYDLTFVDGALEIAKAKATVTANSLNTVYNGKDQTVTGFSASGLVAGEDEAVLSGVTATVTGKNAGSYINTATGTDGNYDITFVDGALEIAKAKATVTANSLNTVYNGKDQTVTGFTASGLVNGETEAVLNGVTATVTGKNAGSYINTATGTDGNYDITFVDGALEIAKAKATVTANSLNTVYNGKDQTVTGFTASGLVAGEDEAVLSGVTATVTGKNAGSYINTATGTDGNYDITFVDGALDIAKAKATITANSLNTVYNGQNQTASGFSATGLVNGEDSSVLTGVTASVTAKDAGSYTNKANGVDKNYDLTFVDGALEIAKAKATVTANSLNTVYNGKDQTVTGFTASGLVAGEDEAVLSNVSASVTAQEVGNYANKATGSDDNYELTFVDGVLSIQAKPIVPVPPQPPVVPSYYPIWGNPYQRAIRTQSVQQKTKAFDIVEIEIEGNGINMDNIQTLGSN